MKVDKELIGKVALWIAIPTVLMVSYYGIKYVKERIDVAKLNKRVQEENKDKITKSENKNT